MKVKDLIKDLGDAEPDADVLIWTPDFGEVGASYLDDDNPGYVVLVSQ